MSEQNKIDEIKEDLNPVADEVWELDVFDVITNQNGKIIAEIFDRDAAPLLRKSIEYITYLLQEIERLQEEVGLWKQAANNQKDNNMKLISVIHDKDEKMRKAITIWETATPEDDFDDIIHAVIDELKDSLAL